MDKCKLIINLTMIFLVISTLSQISTTVQISALSQISTHPLKLQYFLEPPQIKGPNSSHTFLNSKDTSLDCNSYFLSFNYGRIVTGQVLIWGNTVFNLHVCEPQSWIQQKEETQYLKVTSIVSKEFKI